MMKKLMSMRYYSKKMVINLFLVNCLKLAHFIRIKILINKIKYSPIYTDN